MSNQEKKDEKQFVTPVTFCPMGHLPTAANYEILISDLENKLKDLAKQNLEGVHSASIECFSTAPEAKIQAYIWLDPNSPEIVNTSAKKQNSAIQMNIPFQSQKLKAFMKKYCREDRRKLIVAEQNNSYKGIEINFDVFMQEFFDVDGSLYASMFGGTPVRSKLEIKKVFAKRGEPRLISINVKKFKAGKNVGKLTAKRNMKM